MAEGKSLERRQHSPELRMLVLRQCAAPGATVAKVALAHDLNPSLVYEWRRRAESGQADGIAAARGRAPSPAFVALGLPTPPAPAGEIQVEWRRSSTVVTVAWPTAAAADCAAWLRELLR